MECEMPVGGVQVARSGCQLHGAVWNSGEGPGLSKPYCLPPLPLQAILQMLGRFSKMQI